MKKLKKSEIIEQFVDHGLFDTQDISNTYQLIGDAGDRLDDACSHDICGSPVFKCADGKWYVGNVEFQIAPVNPKYLVDVLADGEHCECPHCKHIDNLGDMADIGSEDTAGDGLCTKCTHISFKITRTRAEQIAGITKVPKKRRKGLK